MRSLTLVLFLSTVISACAGSRPGPIQRATIFDQDPRTDSKSVAEGSLRMAGNWNTACRILAANVSKSSSISFASDNTGSNTDRVFNSADCSGAQASEDSNTFRAIVTKAYGTDKDFGLDLTYLVENPAEGKISSLALRVEIIADDAQLTTQSAMVIVKGKPTAIPQDQIDHLPVLRAHRQTN